MNRRICVIRVTVCPSVYVYVCVCVCTCNFGKIFSRKLLLLTDTHSATFYIHEFVGVPARSATGGRSCSILSVPLLQQRKTEKMPLRSGSIMRCNTIVGSKYRCMELPAYLLLA